MRPPRPSPSLDGGSSEVLAAGAQRGWLALLGGGEFTFGETEEADRFWLDHAGAGPVGFVPAAAGSADYGKYFSAYLKRLFEREVEVIPIYRDRDARRGKNLERLRACPIVYLAGGVPDHLLDAIGGSPAADLLREKVATGGMVVAIAAAAQCCGAVVRSVFGGRMLSGLDLAPGSVVETNFDPGHDRRLRKLLAMGGVRRAIGLPAGSALLLGPEGREETLGTLFSLDEPEGDLQPWMGALKAGISSGGRD
ncbi:MAG: Type 1 glutamine amidotransferase-like domain-containing protein [Thermoanaerobaculia bacterium]